jgi:hypothetical protein
MGRPALSAANDFRPDVARYLASSSVSAATMLTPRMTYGF